MSGLLDGLAQYLADLGHGQWSPAAGYGADAVGIVVGHLPASPDRVIGLSTYPGGESDARLPYDEPNVQIRVRGAPDDAADSRDRAQAIYDDLHGTGHLVLAGPVEVVNMIGLQAGPIDIGADANNRYEHTVNVRVEHLRPTMHRP